MKLFAKFIDDKLAILYLDESTFYLYVVYDGKTIQQIDDNTWQNIKSEEWLYEAIVDFAVNNYKSSIKNSDFDALLYELD